MTDSEFKALVDDTVSTEPLAEEEYEQFLTFSLGEEEFAINIMLVSEIDVWSEPTRLPNVPKYLSGVVNLRGVIVPIINLRMRFGMKLLDSQEKSVIIFLQLAHRTVGIGVDLVSDIINVDQEKVKPAPKIEGEIKDEFVNGLINSEGRMLVLLDIEKIFEESNKKEMSATI